MSIDLIICNHLKNDLFCLVLSKYNDKTKIFNDIVNNEDYELEHFRYLYDEMGAINILNDNCISRTDYILTLGRVIQRKYFNHIIND